MKKWYIIMAVAFVIMLGSTFAKLFVDQEWWLLLEFLYAVGLAGIIICFWIVGRKQSKELDQQCKDIERTFDKFLENYRRLPWISVDYRLPDEGEVVFIAFRDKTGFGVNVATFEKGVFNSYSTNKPDYWMHVPVLPKVEEK